MGEHQVLSSQTAVVPLGERFGVPSGPTVATYPSRCSSTALHLMVEHRHRRSIAFLVSSAISMDETTSARPVVAADGLRRSAVAGDVAQPSYSATSRTREGRPSGDPTFLGDDRRRLPPAAGRRDRRGSPGTWRRIPRWPSSRYRTHMLIGHPERWTPPRPGASRHGRVGTRRASSGNAPSPTTSSHDRPPPRPAAQLLLLFLHVTWALVPDADGRRAPVGSALSARGSGSRGAGDQLLVEASIRARPVSVAILRGCACSDTGSVTVSTPGRRTLEVGAVEAVLGNAAGCRCRAVARRRRPRRPRCDPARLAEIVEHVALDGEVDGVGIARSRVDGDLVAVSIGIHPTVEDGRRQIWSNWSARRS